MNKNGTPVNSDSIIYLVSTYSKQMARRVTANLIRASVITSFLKQGMDTRVIQAFTGHKKTSTTERYSQTGLEELKIAIENLHPLGQNKNEVGEYYVNQVKGKEKLVT